MPKKTKLPAKHPAKRVRHLPDSKIDFSDIPELPDKELKQHRPVGRPKLARPKQLLAIRIDPSLLTAIRALAVTQKKPYQRLMHELLESGVRRRGAA